MSKKTDSGIQTKNEFAPLADLEEQEESDMDTEEESNERNSRQKVKERKPPPLVIHGNIKEHKKFVDTIKQTVEDKFHLKYHEECVEVFLHNRKDYDTLFKVWKSRQIKFHTYTSKEEKRRTYIIKGLHDRIETSEVKESLEQLDITVHNISLMKGTMKPMFLVAVDKIKLGILKQKAQYVCYTKVVWDNYINKRRLAQCHRCQEWGHSTINCHADPVCLKCAEEHLTKECKKPVSEPAKCINCGKDYPANATICEAYKKRLIRVERMQDTRKARFDHAERRIKQPDLKDIRQFPILKTIRTSEIDRGWMVSDKDRLENKSNYRIKGKQEDTEVSKNIQNTNNDFLDFIKLIEEVKKLNAKFNVRNMLVLVKKLNQKMEQCNEQIEKFQIFIEFCQSLETECTQ